MVKKGIWVKIGEYCSGDGGWFMEGLLDCLWGVSEKEVQLKKLY